MDLPTKPSFLTTEKRFSLYEHTNSDSVDVGFWLCLTCGRSAVLWVLWRPLLDRYLWSYNVHLLPWTRGYRDSIRRLG